MIVTIFSNDMLLFMGEHLPGAFTDVLTSLGGDLLPYAASMYGDRFLSTEIQSLQIPAFRHTPACRFETLLFKNTLNFMDLSCL